MGGFGSTRWASHTKREVVEDCRVLSIFDLNQARVLDAGASIGNLSWNLAFSGKRAAEVGYEFNLVRRYLRIFYAISRWNRHQETFDYLIGLETSRCNFGGYRWWFICPVVNCNRRVAKVYLPPGGRHFGCRHCHELTYQSSQESDKRVSALRELGRTAILEGVARGEIDVGLASNALTKEFLN